MSSQNHIDTSDSNTRRPRRWLRVIVPALLLPGLFATTALARGGGWHGGEGVSEEQKERFIERRLDRMLDHVNATSEQESRIKAVVANHKASFKALHQQRRALKEATHAVLTAPQVDPAAVEALRTKMVAQMEASSKLFSNVVVEVAQILTPEQRQQLAEHMAGRHGGPFGF